MQELPTGTSRSPARDSVGGGEGAENPFASRGTAFHEASSSDLFDAPDALVWDAQSRTMVQVTGEVLYSEVAPVGLLFDVGGVTEHTIFNRVIDDRTHVFDGGGRGILNHGPVSRGGRVEFWGMFTHAFLHLFLCRLALGTPTTFASFLRDKLVEWSITSTGMSKIWSLIDGSLCTDSVFDYITLMRTDYSVYPSMFDPKDYFRCRCTFHRSDRVILVYDAACKVCEQANKTWKQMRKLSAFLNQIRFMVLHRHITSMMNERGIRRAAAMPGGGPQASVPVIVGDGTADSIAKRNWNTSARDEVNGPRLPPLGKAENSSKRRSRQMMLPRKADRDLLVLLRRGDVVAPNKAFTSLVGWVLKHRVAVTPFLRLQYLQDNQCWAALPWQDAAQTATSGVRMAPSCIDALHAEMGALENGIEGGGWRVCW
ncbi:hypothetical protein T484DRAFT_1823296 [Baffinella frigidus]|nr:hypothetical protein T484DRAFT_1823296 [Cryptophyta sp. CCMP2293]